MRKFILRLFLSLTLLTLTSAFAILAPSATSEAVSWSTNEIILDFPETATFRAAFTSAVETTSIVLEYGNEQQTCGEVIAKAFPQFAPGRTVKAEWTWEMRQSGSLPPGAQFWWRWRVTDASGDEARMQTYGFNVNGLETAWRTSIGASPSSASAPTARPTPTFVPTIVPMGGGSVASVLQATSTPVPTSSFGEQPTPAPARTGPPLALTMILLGLCCAFLVLLGVVVLGFVVRSQNRKGGDNVQS